MDIAAAVQKFAASSAYRYGDNLSFQVPVTKEHRLPGRHDPEDYLTDFKTPGRAAVICPGNGGLVAQLFLNGATEVVAIEPRDRWHEPLKAVMKLFIEANPGKQIQVYTEFPTLKEHIKKIGTFDTILWFEGADDLGDPSVFHLVAQMLKPNGRMKIELAHGTSVHTSGKINNWRPTAECFREHVEKVAKLGVQGPGRLGTTKTYVVTEPKAAEASTPVTAAPHIEPMLKRTEPKTESMTKPQAPEPKAASAPAPAPAPTPAPAVESKPTEAWPRPDAPKPAPKLNAAPPTASVGSDDNVDLKPRKPSLKKP
jgi:hypothetical protein